MRCRCCCERICQSAFAILPIHNDPKCRAAAFVDGIVHLCNLAGRNPMTDPLADLELFLENHLQDQLEIALLGLMKDTGLRGVGGAVDMRPDHCDAA